MNQHAKYLTSSTSSYCTDTHTRPIAIIWIDHQNGWFPGLAACISGPVIVIPRVVLMSVTATSQTVRRGVVQRRWSRSTRLTYAEPG